jgi:uncharacterized protein YaaW (UPF0174 family)
LRTVAFFAAVLAAPKARAVRTPDLASILTERVSALETAGFGVLRGVLRVRVVVVFGGPVSSLRRWRGKTDNGGLREAREVS